MIFIYSLSDPNSNMIRYIGKTKNISYRYYYHIYDAINKCKTRKDKWIKKLLKINQRPTMEILDTVCCKDADFWEMHYISLFKSWGFKLTNGTMGGEGFLDLTGEIAKKISQSKKNYKFTNKHIENLIKSHIGIKQSELTKQKISNTLKGTKKPPRTQEHLDKISKAKRGVSINKGIIRPYARKRVAQIDIKTNAIVKIWESISEAQTALNIGNHIGSVCSGKRKSIGGFKWKFL